MNSYQAKSDGDHGHGGGKTDHQIHARDSEPPLKTEWIKEPNGRRGTEEDPE